MYLKSNSEFVYKNETTALPADYDGRLLSLLWNTSTHQLISRGNTPYH